MKPVLTFLLWVACLNVSNATVVTLCNMPYSPGQYTTFDNALTNISNGDTIYVHGSSINYGSVSIWRPVVVIGTGHHPNKQYPLVSSFGDITINSNNVQLIGLQMTYLFNFGYTDGAVKKCRIQRQTSNEAVYMAASASWLFEGNIIESNGTGINFVGYPAPNTIIRHNAFITHYSGVQGIYNNAGQLTYILNNVFLPDFPSGQYGIYDLRNCLIENNIFHSTAPGGNIGVMQGCTMNNNLSFMTVDNGFYSPGANNVVNADPQFVTFPGLNPQYDYNWDLNLAATSPGHNTGTDGTDRGVFGGLGNLFTATGEPAIAEITAFTITSPTIIAPGGSLTISITSKRVH